MRVWLVGVFLAVFAGAIWLGVTRVGHACSAARDMPRRPSAPALEVRYPAWRIVCPPTKTRS